MVFGDPRKIKERHFKLKEYLAKESPESLDALISISSGNPVIRFPPRNEVYYLGLYNTIGRNSIPLFVGEGFHNRWEEKRKDKRLAQDATVTRVLKEPTKNGVTFYQFLDLKEEKQVMLFSLKTAPVKSILKTKPVFWKLISGLLIVSVEKKNGLKGVQIYLTKKR